MRRGSWRIITALAMEAITAPVITTAMRAGQDTWREEVSTLPVAGMAISLVIVLASTSVLSAASFSLVFASVFAVALGVG